LYDYKTLYDYYTVNTFHNLNEGVHILRENGEGVKLDLTRTFIVERGKNIIFKVGVSFRNKRG